MRLWKIVSMVVLGVSLTGCYTEHYHQRPVVYRQDNGVPPGLAKKPHHCPPGQAKKGNC